MTDRNALADDGWNCSLCSIHFATYNEYVQHKERGHQEFKPAPTAAPTLGREDSPDDLRALGWSVAVHNDYRLNGVPHTFWLLTKDGRAIKGEGFTDSAALNAIRAALTAPDKGGPDLTAVREAFRAGWYVNACPASDGEDEQPASYLKGCEEVDWNDYAARSVAETKEPRYIPGSGIPYGDGRTD